MQIHGYDHYTTMIHQLCSCFGQKRLNSVVELDCEYQNQKQN